MIGKKGNLKNSINKTKKNSKATIKWWKKKNYHADLKFFIKVSLILMIFVQVFIQYNNFQVSWKDEKVSSIVVDETNNSSLILAVDAKSGKAGAMDYEGNTIIPFTSSTFDPWTGKLISDGLYHNGNLYWVIEDQRVGIVNEKNEEVIPKNYGYLKLAQENQFIAGDGTITQYTLNGSYAYQKYGVIAETGETVIPIEYDTMKLNEDGTYTGVFTEGKYKITRVFEKNGTLRKETQEQVISDEAMGETKAEESTAASETQPEESSNAVQTSPTDEGQPIEPISIPIAEDDDYEKSSETESETEEEIIITKIYDGGDREIYFDQGICTLRVTENQVPIFEFPEERIADVNVPTFINDNKLIQDIRGDGTYIYSSKNADVICVVGSELDYACWGDLIVFETDSEYIVKNMDNRELYRVARGANDNFMNSPNEKPRFVFQNDYFVYQSDTDRTLITNKGIVIADDLDIISYNSENTTKDDERDKIFICQRDDKYAAFNALGDKVLDFVYKKIEFFTGHTEELKVTKTNGKMGIVDYRGVEVIPIEFDNVGYGVDVTGASDKTIETYVLLSEAGEGNKYFGQDGNEIYYLDAQGNKVKRVQYVLKQEKNSSSTDIVTIGNQLETPISYRITGNHLIMDNAYSAGFTYRRSQIEEHLYTNGITFLCIDSLTNRIGVYNYTYGQTTLMGYQDIFWTIWGVLSWIFIISLILVIVTGFQFISIIRYIQQKFAKNPKPTK